MFYIEHFQQTNREAWRLVNCHLVSDYCTSKLIESLKRQGYTFNRALKAYCLKTDYSDNRFIIHKHHIK